MDFFETVNTCEKIANDYNSGVIDGETAMAAAEMLKQNIVSAGYTGMALKTLTEYLDNIVIGTVVDATDEEKAVAEQFSSAMGF